MTIRVLINGAYGKMGQETVKALSADQNYTIVAKTGKQDSLVDIIQQTQPQIVIDLTTASAAFNNANTIINANVHPIIGTSGLLPEQIQLLTKRCAEQQLGGIIAPNFSLGVLLMMQFAQQAAKYFTHVEIIEMHHATKEDSPSGTAIRTAELINQARKEQPKIDKGRETVTHARGANHANVPIHAIRLPGLVAHQSIIFGDTGQTLTLKHDTLHRESFMAGVKLACQKVTTINQLIYGLEYFL